MSNLATALALILAVETPNMDPLAVGDRHLPRSQWAFGRMQMRKPMLDDLTNWSRGLKYHHLDAMNTDLDVLMAAWWLKKRAGDKADVKTYLTTWNGGRVGRHSRMARDYYRRAVTVKSTRPKHYKKALAEVRKAGIR